MTNQESPPGPLHRGHATGRLEAFGDAVFAIAVTLLVLDIAVPASAEAHLLRSVVDLWPFIGKNSPEHPSRIPHQVFHAPSFMIP